MGDCSSCNSECAPIDLRANTCPNREQRANGINVFFGKASELVKGAREGTLRNCERKFQQTSGCVLNFYLTVRVSTIRNAVAIYHAPVGCSSASLGYRELYRAIPPELGRPAKFDLKWLTTNLNNQDVVYGAVDKLKKAILLAEERYAPRAIFILTSCTTGIIGDDIEGAVRDVQDQVEAKIVPVHCEGVRSRLVQTGYDAFWHGVLKYLVRKPKKKQRDLVNVASMLSYCWQDRLEIERLFKRLGLRANFIPEFATVEQLEQLSEAAVTAPLCPSYTDYLSRGLYEQYGVPFFMYPMPVGIASTDGWLREIAKHTGKEKEVEALIKEEHAVWQPKMDVIKEAFRKLKLDGSKVRVQGSLGQGRLLSQTPYFDELGLEHSVAVLQDFDNLVLDDAENMIKKHGDFNVLVNTFQAAEQTHIARVTDPDLVLTCPFQGQAYKRAKSVARIHSLRGDPQYPSVQAGYTGAVIFGEFLLKSFKTQSFQRTMMEKTKNTYKEWWFQQPNPLFYVDTEAATV
jgi:nitrogenase molybdenum-iron protein alpha chain